MSKLTGKPPIEADLRKNAEQDMAAQSEWVTDALLTNEKRLLLESQVHQIELKMQNEALQEAYRQAEQTGERYTELFDFAPIAYFTLGRDSTIHRTNLRGANLLDVESSRIAGRHFIEYVSPENRPVFNRFLDEIFLSDHIQLCELPLQLGKTRCWVAIKAIADKDRKTCLTAVSDISERKQAERVSNLLTAVIDNALDGFWVVDMVGNLLQVNKAYAKMSGYSMDELLNMHISQLEANEGPEQIDAHIAKVIEQGYDRFETRHRHKDGHGFDVEISVTFLSEFQQFCVFCRDITARKQTEGKLDAIFNASVDGIISFDLSCNIVSANAAMEPIFGYKPEELMGRNIRTIIPLLPKCGNDNGYSSQSVIGSTVILEIEGRHKNGSAIHLEMSKAQYAIHDECYFILIIRDIGLRKQRERQDKIHLDELAHITRLGLMGEMASGIAHEVNQPLTAIASYAQASINLIHSENPDLAYLAEILYKTQHQAIRAGQIIHRMREFLKSRPEHRSTVDINGLLHDALSLCIAEIKQHNIEITCDLEKNLPPVYADHVQIEQVLINLIRNSIDTLQSLPVNQPRHLSFHTQLTDNNDIQVRVKDNGPGIDKDQQLKILTPFYTTKKTGMGMGLSICRSLIEAHKGSLRFKSKVGKGSTFYFTLPVT